MARRRKRHTRPRARMRLFAIEKFDLYGGKRDSIMNEQNNKKLGRNYYRKKR